MPKLAPGRRQTFERNNRRYVPGPLVRYNGKEGHIWTVWIEMDERGWLHEGKQFHARKATHDQIAEANHA